MFPNDTTNEMLARAIAETEEKRRADKSLRLSGVNIAEVVRGYLGAQLWTGSQEDEESGETVQLDSLFTIDDFPADYVERLTDELSSWCSSYPLALRLYAARRAASVDAHEGSVWDYLGHDILLTRDHHGAGFWDRGLGELGDYLTAQTHPMGSSAYLWFSNEDELLVDG